jgi:hypothetical protein
LTHAPKTTTKAATDINIGMNFGNNSQTNNPQTATSFLFLFLWSTLARTDEKIKENDLFERPQHPINRGDKKIK